MNQTATKRDRMTVDQFLEAYATLDGRYELIDGVPVMMAGALPRHNRVQGNLFANLYRLLGDGPCEVFNSDMGLQITEHDFRLPDVAIYCHQADLTADGETERRRFNHPRVVFEILSASTANTDTYIKLIEYQSLPSVDTIVMIDPDRRIFTTYERAENNAWTMMTHLHGSALRLRNPEIVMTSDEIFRRVGPLDRTD